MSFAGDLQRFKARSLEHAHEVVGDIVVGVAAELDRRSPVGDPRTWLQPAPADYEPGHFRGNWQLGVDEAPTGEVEGVDPAGARTLAVNIGRIPADAMGKVYHIVNNVPYAVRLENGWSRQAPQGIVALTVLEFPRIVAQSARAFQ